MKIFVSWSGELSRAIASILRERLPIMIQSLEVFMSKRDLGSGTRWGPELAKELDAANFGILCLTPDNLHSDWLLFEAGALTKHAEGRACGILIGGLKVADITGPLLQFQHRDFSQGDMKLVLADINAKLAKPLETSQLDAIFEKWWPDLNQHYEEALATKPTERKPRNQPELLEEILGRVRAMEATLPRAAPGHSLVKEIDRMVTAGTHEEDVIRQLAERFPGISQDWLKYLIHLRSLAPAAPTGFRKVGD